VSLPSSKLVLIEDRRESQSPWSDQLAALIATFSTNRDFTPYDIVAELTLRDCFSTEGRTTLGPHVFHQSVDDTSHRSIQEMDSRAIACQRKRRDSSTQP
jgi:hypothetical protein